MVAPRASTRALPPLTLAPSLDGPTREEVQELTERYARLEEEHTALRDSHLELRLDYERLLERLQRASAKIERDREKIQDWQKWYDRHTKRPEVRFPSRQTRTSAQAHVLPGSVTPFARESSTLSASEASASDDLPQLPAPEPLYDVGAALREPGEDALPTTSDSAVSDIDQGRQFLRDVQPTRSQHPSSQTTEGEPPSTLLPVILTVEDDEPIVVSARTTVRGRKAAKIKREPSPEGTPRQPPTIPRLKTLSSQQSDLDHISGRVATPRKGQKLSSPETTTHVLRHDHAGNDENHDPLQRHARTVKQRPQGSPVRISVGPLTPLSVNTPNLPRDSDSSTNTVVQRKRSPWRFEDVTEDGGSRKRQKTTDQRSAILDGLLEGNQTPLQDTRSHSELSKARRAPSTSRRRTSEAADKMLRQNARRLASNSTTPLQDRGRRISTLSREITRPAAPLPIEPEHEPLRSRPLRNLALSDFKINPAFADRDYAYVESIRKRDERRCLPGCTRPECCGQLLKFATDDDLPASGGATSSLTDDDIIHDFLGPAGYQTWLSTWPSPEDRAGMITKAKQQKFMDKYSRHRRVFEKGSTPPGFWRTEMPSTQELEQDRAEATRREREKVEERYMDALKGNSRWLFRDE